jgi:hypothetical protein
MICERPAHSAFGWATLPTFDMPGGAPAYPLSALGVRARAHEGDFTFLAGAFNGSPVYDNSGDPQKQNCCGVSFPLNGGVLAIVKLQYATPTSGDKARAEGGRCREPTRSASGTTAKNSPICATISTAFP